MIDRSTIQRVIDAADIVDVVKDFVTLRKAGVNYKGLCPFHNEKTPSFTVSPTKQLCKCFSCGKGGNVVHFLMELEQMTYPEAIRWLAKKYGIEVEESEMTDEQRRMQSKRESMFILNEWAQSYFTDILRNNVDGVAIGLAYFRSRGFRDDVIKKFRLGYSLESRDALAKTALSMGFSEEYLVETGLCFRTEDGRLLDRYHGRVVFPVFTVSGKTVAFGGRILSSDKKLAKYVNSPESEIYSKSHELYGLFQAKSAIVKHGRCFLVEGYTDVISMHQCGVENVVASSGTSLTEGQIRLLHRFTNDITVLYDGDNAGIKASLRGIDMLLSEGMNIKVLLLPDGEDPDSFARKHRADEFQQYIDSHQVDFIKFKINLLLAECGDDPIKRASLITDIVRSISVIPDNIVRQMYVRECASLLNVTETLIVTEIGQMKRAKEGGIRSDAHDVKEKTIEQQQIVDLTSSELREEQLLISLVIRYGECRIKLQNEDEVGETLSVATYIARSLEEDELILHSPIHKRILEEAIENEGNSNWQSAKFFNFHTDSAISKLAAECTSDKFTLSTRQREHFTPDSQRLNEIVPRILNDYKHAVLKTQMKRIENALHDPAMKSDSKQAVHLMKQYMQLAEIERKFAHILGERVLVR